MCVQVSVDKYSRTSKDVPNKEHISTKDKLCSLSNTILPLKEDNLSITVKLAGPKVSVISQH